MTHRAARRFELPVRGGPVLLRLPTGVEEMLLVETAQSDTGLALDLAGRLASTMDGEPLDWNQLPVTDLDAFVLGLRRAWVGDRIIADTACGAENCGARVDISFKISDYLAYHRPKRGGLRLRGWRVIEAVGDPGWYHLNRCGEEAARPAASFKLPTGPDLLAVEGRPDAADALARRCMGPAELPAGARSRVEAAMEALSPNLAGDVGGSCPECGAAVKAHFDPRHFCLQEMRDRARFAYDDVDVLARHYHWTERAILILPTERRASYAERARQAGAT